MHASTQALFDWLVDGAPGATSAADLAERIGVRLREAGVPIDRFMAFVLTLHPNVLGRSFRWEPGRAVKVSELTEAIRHSAMFSQSPIVWVNQSKVECRIALPPPADTPFPVAHDLAQDGFTDYVCMPMAFQNGEIHAVSFATKNPGGFSNDDLDSMRHVTRPLTRIAEIFALRRTASNVLATYVGRRTSEHIFAGRIVKGDIETIRAAIWFSDLRGFTELSGRIPAPETIAILNDLFDCQVPTIDAHGGEVLKFIGDGLLAIFPIAAEADTASRCKAAFEAAADAFAAVDARNAKAARPIAFGLALHVGEVAYGNIGGATRLDFTAIGPAVNLAARLEGLTGKLGKRLVTSEAFATHVGGLEPVGEFELKGIVGLQRLFAPT